MRRLLPLAPALLLAACVSREVPPPRAALPPVATALPAAPPQADWRDVPLAPGTWTWRGGPGQPSLAQFGLLGAAAVFALRCDLPTRTVVLSRAGTLPAPGAMTVTTSFGGWTLPAAQGSGQPPAIVASLPARDPRLDQLAFSRGRFRVDVPGQQQLILPAWPEVGRVVEDCRS